MKAAGAGLVRILVDEVASHLDNPTDGVVEMRAIGIGVDGGEVLANPLVGEEAAVGGDGQSAGLQEAVELVHSPEGRILHQVLHELDEAVDRLLLLEKVEDPGRESVVHRGAIVLELVVVDGDATVRELGNRLGDVDQGLDLSLGSAAGEKGVDDGLVVGVIVRDRLHLTIEIEIDTALGHHERDGHVHKCLRIFLFDVV